MTRLIATSVVRGSHQGESHGGIFLVDLEREEILQSVDWNKMDIDWQGRGWDRGLRGIEFHKDRIYVAASDEIFVFDQSFHVVETFRNPYLKHCHEICINQDHLFVTSTGFDSILGLNLLSGEFDLKPAVSAVVTSGSLPVSKTQLLFRRYLLTWMIMQLLQHQHCCRTAELRRQWACLSKGINPTIALTCCSWSGSRMALFAWASELA